MLGFHRGNILINLSEGKLIIPCMSETYSPGGSYNTLVDLAVYGFWFFEW